MRFCLPANAPVRLVVGGDYGISIAPHGSYAKDLEYFVDLFHLSPADALLCATRDGGAAASPDGMAGTLEEGKYADLLVVDGNPLADVRILQDQSRITAVMKDGCIYRGLQRTNPYAADSAEFLGTVAHPHTRTEVTELLNETAG